jgi:hypothetical protein
MEDFIRKRYALARAQLDAPGERPRPQPMEPPKNQRGPQPGPPSPDAPTDLRAVNVTLTSVELGWANHADGVVAYVVQRFGGSDATDFANAIGPAREGCHDGDRPECEAREDLSVSGLWRATHAGGTTRDRCL